MTPEGDRSKISPYSPSSRLFLEPIFIDPAAIEGFAGSEAARLLENSESREALASLREAPLIDHAAVWDLKRPLLEALWALFRRDGGLDDLVQIDPQRFGDLAKRGDFGSVGMLEHPADGRGRRGRCCGR